MRKISAKVGLGLILVAFVFAIVSFLRENWGADATPGALESLVAKWILSRSRPSSDETRNPLPATAENLQEGRQQYEKYCAFCHGLDGHGQNPAGIQFYPPVPSLVDPTSEMTDGQIHWIVTRGIRYTAMPSFAKVLPADEIWKIVLWVRHLSQAPAPAQPGLSPGEANRRP